MRILDRSSLVEMLRQAFASLWERERVASVRRQRKRAMRLSPSEIMTIPVLFQTSGYRAEFLRLVSYTRLVALILRVLCPLAIFLLTQLAQEALTLPRA